MRARDVLELTLLAAIWGASFLFMRIAAPQFGPVALAAVRVAGAALVLALLCSGVGYILYFRLIAHTGATNAASVTFLIPLFAVLWGGWLLDEVVTPAMMMGATVMVAGTLLVLGLLPRRVPPRT